jgi:hypothetical protein
MADRSVFDGYSLTLHRSDGSIVGSWPAISGRNGNQRPSDQNLPFKGPLTEGTDSFSTGDIQPLTTLDAVIGLAPHRGRFPESMAAWGMERVALAPIDVDQWPKQFLHSWRLHHRSVMYRQDRMKRHISTRYASRRTVS